MTEIDIYKRLEHCLNANYISFDVFDTLLFRTVNQYRDIFDLVALMYKEKVGREICEFKKQRVSAESKARAIRFGKEITLDMIYSYLPYDDKTCDLLKNIEVKCEICNCVSNHAMVDLLNKIKKQGKKIIITTDMYLPRSFFEIVLRKIGVNYDFLFISSEEGETKRTGKLFQIVLDKLGIKPSQLVHIGDDKNNDIIQPSKFGIKTIETPKYTSMKLPYSFQSKSDLKLCIFQNFLLKGLQNHGSDEPEFILGYTIVGPLLWDFCRWVHQIKIERKLTKLLFVAREGYLIKKFYELIYPEEMSSIEYIRINKNLLRLPLLDTDDCVGHFLKSVPRRTDFEWSDILKYLFVKDIQLFLCSLHKEYPTVDFTKAVKLTSIEKGEVNHILAYIIDKQKKQILEQKEMLKNYLVIHGFVNEKIGLVNNSINGSGQSLVEEFLKDNGCSSNIVGLQFVRNKKCISRLGNRSEAWLSYNHLGLYERTRFISLSLIFEHLMFEPEGTAVKFSQTESGFVVPVCENPRTEVRDFEKIEKLQYYALQFVRDYQKNMYFSFCDWGIKRYLNFLLFPRSSEAKFVCELWDDDVEEDKQITNTTIPYKLKYSLLKDVPKDIVWMEGYLSVKNVNLLLRLIFRLRCSLRIHVNQLKDSLHKYCR